MSRSLAAVLLTAAVAGTTEPRHGVVFHNPKTFAGWPANGGLWVYDGGKEAVVAFTTGPYRLRGGHNVVPPYKNVVARTRDGGARRGRATTRPASTSPATDPRALTSPIPFDRPISHCGSSAPATTRPSCRPAACVIPPTAARRGRPPRLPPLIRDGRTELTLRTEYRVLGPRDCFVFGSAVRRKVQHRPHLRREADRRRAAAASFLGWLNAPTPPSGRRCPRPPAATGCSPRCGCGRPTPTPTASTGTPRPTAAAAGAAHGHGRRDGRGERQPAGGRPPPRRAARLLRRPDAAQAFRGRRRGREDVGRRSGTAGRPGTGRARRRGPRLPAAVRAAGRGGGVRVLLGVEGPADAPHRGNDFATVEALTVTPLRGASAVGWNSQPGRLRHRAGPTGPSGRPSHG